MVNRWQFLLEFQDGAIANRPMFGSAVDDGRTQTRGKVAAQACIPSLAITRFLAADAVVSDATGGGSLTGQLIERLTSSPGFVETCRLALRRTSAATPVIAIRPAPSRRKTPAALRMRRLLGGEGDDATTRQADARLIGAVTAALPPPSTLCIRLCRSAYRNGFAMT